jgi:Sec7-like guanine-nucleotide exchange factor
MCSIRKFLQSFLLPGEAQQIDRLMLKFAERYVVNNPTTFANAGIIFTLNNNNNKTLTATAKKNNNNDILIRFSHIRYCLRISLLSHHAKC